MMGEKLPSKVAVWRCTATPPPQIFLLRMLQGFFIGLRSGDDCGHTMTFFPFLPIAARDAVVFFAAWDGALSCMKARFFLLLHGTKQSIRIFMLFAGVILTPSGTQKEPTLSSIPAQSLTPPPPLLMSQPCQDMVAISI